MKFSVIQFILIVFLVVTLPVLDLAGQPRGRYFLETSVPITVRFPINDSITPCIKAIGDSGSSGSSVITLQISVVNRAQSAQTIRVSVGGKTNRSALTQKLITIPGATDNYISPAQEVGFLVELTSIFYPSGIKFKNLKNLTFVLTAVNNHPKKSLQLRKLFVVCNN